MRPADTDYLEEELTEGSELTDAEEIDHASDLDVNDLEASGLEANGLTASAPIAATLAVRSRCPVSSKTRARGG